MRFNILWACSVQHAFQYTSPSQKTLEKLHVITLFLFKAYQNHSLAKTLFLLAKETRLRFIMHDFTLFVHH